MDYQSSLSVEKYQKIFFLNDDDIALVKETSKQIENLAAAAFSELYAWMEYNLENAPIDLIIDQITVQETELWQDLTMAQVNEAAVQRQWQMAQWFQRMDIPFETCMSTLLALHEVIENVFLRQKIGSFELLRSFKKIAGIHICVVIDAYNESINQKIVLQNETLMEMSAPVAKLWAGILFLPLVGFIDSRRAQNLMVTMLTQVMETQSKVFILDISGIAILDTAVANHLIKMTKATKLMGCTCIVSGISPAVAQTIVELGIEINEMNTTGNLQDAIARGFKLTGVSITNSF